MSSIRLQHRKYLGKDRKTKYVQYRINIPHDVIRTLGRSDESQILLKANKKKKILSLELKTENL